MPVHEEPDWIRFVRRAYYRSRERRDELEARIAQTLGGQRFIDRVKRRKRK